MLSRPHQCTCIHQNEGCHSTRLDFVRILLEHRADPMPSCTSVRFCLFLLGSGCAKMLGHLKFHLSQKGICLWYVVTQFVAEDKSPFLVSMIHASRTFWTNCFFALCVTQMFEITQEAYDKVSQGLFSTKSLQLPAKKKSPRNPRLSMRNIRDEQGETPLMEACGPEKTTQQQVLKG